KSSLLGVLAGIVALDDGELKTRDALRIVLVPQEPAFPANVPAPAHKLAEYQQRLGVDAELDAARASGGERKRAALAAAFAQEPDVLLLDEPTNHLDIDGILALENLLARQPAAILVTHDRAFLDRVATRILKLAIGEGRRSGKLVAELAGVSKSYADRTLVKDLDLIISRGDRVGLIGPNGAGKTTLLKLILGELAPDSGRVRLGANVQPAYFDQLRAALDLEKTVADTISPGSEWVEAAGGKKHVMSYLGDFLFPPRRANAKV